MSRHGVRCRTGPSRIKRRNIVRVVRGAIGVVADRQFRSCGQWRSLYRNTSFLVDSLGSAFFSKKVQISERPHLRGGFASGFDSDGVATQDREVVVDGVLQGYFLNAYTARKLGMQTTANAGSLPA